MNETLLHIGHTIPCLMTFSPELWSHGSALYTACRWHMEKSGFMSTTLYKTMPTKRNNLCTHTHRWHLKTCLADQPPGTGSGNSIMFECARVRELPRKQSVLALPPDHEFVLRDDWPGTANDVGQDQNIHVQSVDLPRNLHLEVKPLRSLALVAKSRLWCLLCKPF